MRFLRRRNLGIARAVRCWLLVLAALTTCMVGCGPSGPEVVPVSGTITKNGQPLSNASVIFYAAAGRPSYGKTDSEGRYSLEYSADVPGAVVGDHTVVITTSDNGPPPTDDLAAPTAQGKVSRPSPNGGPTDVTLPGTITVTADMGTLDLVVP